MPKRKLKQETSQNVFKIADNPRFVSKKREMVLPSNFNRDNKSSGSTNWIYTGATESITNMVILPNDNTLFIADKSSLIGLDMSSQGKVKEAYKVKLKFKRALGAMDVGNKVAAIGFGGIRKHLLRFDENQRRRRFWQRSGRNKFDDRKR